MRESYVEITKNLEGDIEFHGVLTQHDFLALRLDPFDLMLVKECTKDNSKSSDWLLALEYLFRRMDEQMKVRIEGEVEGILYGG